MARTLREQLLSKQEQDKASAHKLRFSPSPDDPSMNWTAPRRSFELKSFSKLKESFRLFAKSKVNVDKKAAGLKQELGNSFTVDPPRFSCDGIGESKYLWKEPPRRSLDLGCKKPQEDDARSYEPPRRSLDVNMLCKSYYSPDCPREKQQRPNVVARLMGLEDLPESYPRPTKQAPGNNILQELLEIETVTETKKTTLAKNHLRAAEKPTENVSKSVRNYSLESNEQKSRRAANSPLKGGKTSLKEEKSLYPIEEASMQKVQRIEKIQLSELFKQSDNVQKLDVRGSSRNADFEERRSLFKGLLQFKAHKQQQQLQTCRRSSELQEQQSSKDSSKPTSKMPKGVKAPKVSMVVLKSVATEQGLNSTQRTRSVQPQCSHQADEACNRGKNSRISSIMQKTKTKVSSRTLTTQQNAYHAERRIEPGSKPSPSLRATTATNNKEEIQTSCDVPDSAQTESNAKHNKLLNLMKPTIASSGRQLQQHSVRRDRIIAPKKKPEGRTCDINKKNGGFHGSPSRDQSESRAALLNMRNISSPTKMSTPRLDETELGAAGNPSEDDQRAKKDDNQGRKLEETRQLGAVEVAQRHGLVEHKFQAIRTCIEPGDCGRGSPGHVSETRAVSPKVEQASRSNSDMFDNLSPVSVLDLRYSDEYELFPNSTAGAGNEDQVRKAGLDKPTADSHRLRQLMDLKATVFDNVISCGLPEEHEEQQCSEHWSVTKQCKRCIRETSLQLESAIFDNLVYETMIQLDAQHIKTRDKLVYNT